MVADSSTEAELIALHESLDLLMWCRKIMEFMGRDQPTMPIYQDNTSTITQSYLGGPSKHSKKRFIDIKYFKVKEYLETEDIELRYLRTKDQPADFQASIRAGSEFKGWRNIMGIKP